ncbi:NAD(P)-binding protein [Plenodomus tracheiphilus IPT5]|uniref:NAD(P)-binding protein n=1 Tax=Plenodomus tracheiphilus IPT5 TaxID=1408161 RepID=A0A6A7AT94_9PLEO|nr:NAD(P)-binding protein [Plenodomus tracheiphilus IPT5]
MINFGIIGTNWITHSFVSAAHSTGKWNLAAVYSRKQETAQEFASKYPSKTIETFTYLSTLATSPTIDTVYIASPNILHYEQAKLMLSAGKNVILEKPSCSTVAELDELFALAKEKGVILIEAFRHIQEANFKILKQQIPKLGPVYGASITFAQYSSRYEKVLAGEVPNIFNLEMGGGALVDLGVYCVAAAIDLFGAPADATYWPVKIATGADGAGKLILTYPTFTVHLCHSKIYNSDAPSEIYGQNGTLIVPSITDIERITFWDPKTKVRQEVEVQKPEEENLKEEAEEFARIIETRDESARKRLEEHSRDVLWVLEKVRRDNGLLFPGGI